MKSKVLKTVADVMASPVHALPPDALISAAQLEMVTAHVRHIPIVDADNRLIGILSDRDLIRLVPERPMVVSEVMTAPVQALAPSAPAHQAAALMIENHFNAVPVIDEDGTLLGIVTASDFLKIAHTALCGDDAS